MDKRSDWQKKKDAALGMPLYYSSVCMQEVRVRTQGEEVIIRRPCGDCGCEVMAPRRAIAIGRGGASISTKAKILFYRLLAQMTGRCI